MLMWQYDHGELPGCFNSYFKKVRAIHTHNTRASSSNHLSENILVNSDTYGKNLFQFIGPLVFNKIVEFDFYKRCNNKVGFKTNMKKYLIDNWFSTFLIILLDFQSLIGNTTYVPYLGKSCCFDILCRVLSRFCFFLCFCTILTSRSSYIPFRLGLD